jgi:alpha-beta hydrolase superfamily lysophospholipase
VQSRAQTVEWASGRTLGTEREREWVGSAGHSLGGGLACLAALDLRIILPPAVQVSARLSKRIGRRALRVCMSVYPCCMYACIGIAIAVPIHALLCV